MLSPCQKILRFDLGSVWGGREDLGASAVDVTCISASPPLSPKWVLLHPHVTVHPVTPGGLKSGIFGFQATWGEAGSSTTEGGGVLAPCVPWPGCPLPPSSLSPTPEVPFASSQLSAPSTSMGACMPLPHPSRSGAHLFQAPFMLSSAWQGLQVGEAPLPLHTQQPVSERVWVLGLRPRERLEQKRQQEGEACPVQ